MIRNIPNIETTPKKDYAQLLAHNYDTVQECYNMRMPSHLVTGLNQSQQVAADEEHEITVQFGGEDFQIWAGGASGGVKWVLKNDDIQLFFKAPISQKGKVLTWAVQVRYLSGGLWEYGIDALRKRAIGLLLKEGFQIMDDEAKPAEYEPVQKWQRVSRVDYAFDFYSPKFGREMKRPEKLLNSLILPSGVKYGLIGTSNRVETITVGMSRKGCAIQVYDKGREIDEKSGKTWMFKIWEKAGWIPPEDGKAKNVWRLEIRFGKDFMKNRKILCFEEFQEKLQSLLCEAIFKRRMATPDHRAHREDWALHPLWAECYAATEMAGYYAPIGRQQTMRPEAKYKMMEKQQLGITRSMSVLKNGKYDEHGVRFAANEIHRKIASDPEHENKVDKAMERYKYEKEAK